jgi:hypothetical protein
MAQTIPDIEQVINQERRKSALIAIIIANVIFLVLLVPSLMGAAMTTMLVGAGEKNPGVWFVAVIITGFPVIFLLSLTCWIAFAKKRYTGAIVLSFLPLLNVIAFLAVYFFADAISM